MTEATRAVPAPLRLDPEAATRIRAEIKRAGGREVCFLARVLADGQVVEPRAVARGNRSAVLAAARDAEAGEIMVHNHPSGVLEPSDADLELAAKLYAEGLGTAITDNRGEALYVVVEPPKPRTRVELDPDEVDRLFAPGGGLEGEHARYEDRPGQRAMARLVAERYNEGGVAVVEAGTGTGKSLAYLVPAALWAIRNGERTVISTNTINLQEQLVTKDLPLLRGMLPETFRWALVKGRANYVSIRRLLLAAESAPSLFDEDRSSELGALVGWADRTRDGSLSDLARVPPDDVWEEIRSDGDICLKARCPHFHRCFYQQARRSATEADLLVVNHALLFSDLSVRRAIEDWGAPAVLPPYRHVILDEAHNVEDAATSHLGAEVTRIGLFRILSRLDRNGKGVLTAIEERLRAGDDDPEREGLLNAITKRLRPAAHAARDALSDFFDTLDPRVPREGEEPLRLGRGDPRDPTDDEVMAERLDSVIAAFERLRREVDELRIRLEGDPAREERFQDRLLDLGAASRRLASATGALALVLDPRSDAERFVRWIEGSGRARSGPGVRNVRLAAAPVEPGDMLRDALFDRIDTAILTSATLSTDGENFSFIRDRLGLAAPVEPKAATGRSDRILLDEAWEVAPNDSGEPPIDVVEARLPSPFHLQEQVFFGIPTDVPEHRDWDAFQDRTARIAADVAELIDGGLFVLFTSYRALRATAALLRERGVDRRFPLLVHGEGARSKLLGDFTASGRGILLGTSSFWEGVDVPGDPLRGLILQKIPFRVPTEPVTQARTEAIEARGLNGFQHYQVPLAALRLRQGFGRLIRTRSDRGSVLLLDRRILNARYGRRLLAALPEVPTVRAPWAEVRERLARFHLDVDRVESDGRARGVAETRPFAVD